jgi:hypothetical protein
MLKVWSSIIMPKSNSCPGGQSQTLAVTTVEIDRVTLKKLALLVGQSCYNVQSSRTSEILLTSLNKHLDESSNPEEAAKSSLLLAAYLDVVPEWLEESEAALTEAVDQLAFILAASNLGAANSSGSHDDD